MDKDPKKEGRNIAERGLSLDLAEQLDWTTALIWEDKRKDYGEQRYCVLGFIEHRLHMWPPSRNCLNSAGMNVHFLAHPFSSNHRL